MTIRERLAATSYALRECGDALYGAARGWRYMDLDAIDR
jgi:hypothetical protein